MGYRDLAIKRFAKNCFAEGANRLIHEDILMKELILAYRDRKLSKMYSR